MQADLLLKKYGDIIAEEVNVKEVMLLDETLSVTVTYVPLGQKIGSAFGKDTSAVIAAAKAWKATLQHDGTLIVVGENAQWTLAPDMYEIRYSGLEEDHQTIEWGVIISLDITVTAELKREWIARELSRFLNQMRKDAQFQIDEKVKCLYTTSDGYMSEVIAEFAQMLTEEALLSSISFTDSLTDSGTTTYTSEEWEVLFLLSK